MPLSIRVGAQYALLSPGAVHVVDSASRSLPVLVAVTLGPKNVCMCDAPGRFGKTIGSSGASPETEQSVWNSGTMVIPAGTGFEATALYCASAAFQAVWSTSTQPPGVAPGAAEVAAALDGVVEDGVVAGGLVVVAGVVAAGVAGVAEPGPSSR